MRIGSDTLMLYCASEKRVVALRQGEGSTRRIIFFLVLDKVCRLELLYSTVALRSEKSLLGQGPRGVRLAESRTLMKLRLQKAATPAARPVAEEKRGRGACSR